MLMLMIMIMIMMFLICTKKYIQAYLGLALSVNG